jgi:flagellar assembly protein FliH
MSNPAFANSNPAFANAERCAVWTKPNASGPAPFVAWGQALREAFEAPQDEFEMPEEIAPEPQLDIEAIRAEAMAQGFAAGIEAGRREANEERVALRVLASNLECLKAEPTLGLGVMIAATVERLLHQVVGEVEVCRETLMDRAQAAAALIGDETKPAVLKLNPDDLARLDGAELPVHAEADAMLQPGELRLETAGGAIEDGPGLRLERLRAALDRIAAAR